MEAKSLNGTLRTMYFILCKYYKKKSYKQILNSKYWEVECIDIYNFEVY